MKVQQPSSSGQAVPVPSRFAEAKLLQSSERVARCEDAIPPQRKVVLHVTQPVIGGVRDFIEYLVRSLPEYDHVLVSPTIDETLKRVMHEWHPWIGAQREIHPYHDARALFNLVSVLHRVDFHVLHLHSAKAGFLGMLASLTKSRKSRRFKVIYTTHGTPIARQDIGRWQRRLYAGLEKLVSLAADSTVACSHSESRLLALWGISASVVNNTVAAMPFESEKSESSRSVTGCLHNSASLLSAVPGRLRVVGCGRLVAQKDPGMFFEIARRLPIMDFLWLGDGQERPSSLPENARITGWISANQVWDEIKACSVFLSTSQWEGCPLSVLQALSLGKPLVLRRCVGNDDLVENGTNGFVFESIEQALEALLQLHECRPLITTFGIASLQKYESEFSEERFITQYRKLYS